MSLKPGMTVCRRPAWRRRGVTAVAAVFAMLCGLAVTVPAAQATTPPPSADLATVNEAATATVRVPGSNGDLWPSCWSNDDNLYTANGDGNNFGSTRYDAAVGRLSGTPATGLTGTFLAGGSSIGQVWDSPTDYNRKPTGIVCVNGKLYLAVADLRRDVAVDQFDNAPASTIAESDDHGATWTWNTSAPMFGSASTSDPLRFLFTTIMFLDYGKDYANSPDGYVYAYGLDDNWTQAYFGTVPDPTAVYLARVPKTSIMDRSTWQFYTGVSGGSPTWSSNILDKAPVITDTRRVYTSVLNSEPHNFSVISQGGVVYDAGLNRYIYTSFSGSATQGSTTHEFYEAAHPWGPWSLLASTDFGEASSWNNHNGGYAATIPSKFISADGTQMWLQSNWYCSETNPCDYMYALRNVTIQPFVSTTPSNSVDDTNNLAVTGTGVVAISKSAHNANLAVLNNGNTTDSEDDWDDEVKPASWWGYEFTRPYHLNKVVFTTGTVQPDGGWFAANLHVQVRQNGVWVDTSSNSISPSYPYSAAAGSNQTYTITFPAIIGDGVRIIGQPGGSSTFTSASELAVYYASGGGSTGVVNDNDPSVSYTSVAGGGWTYSPARGFGDYGDDEHWTTTNGDAVSYTCSSCSTLGILTEKTPASGSYDVSVDGGAATSINTYNATRIARQLAFLRTGLSPGAHTIRVTKTSGSYGEIDAFLTTDPINDTASGVNYLTAPGGGWTYSPGRGLGDYADDEHWSTTNGDSVTVPFYGTGAVLITETEPNGATINVQLCDASGSSCSAATSVNTYSATRIAQQLVWQNAAPTAAQAQTIKITKTGGTYAQLDSVEAIP